MANLYTFKIIYADCDNRIWREAQISENAFLCDLGYVVLATFDTLAYHLFNIIYDGVMFDLPTEDEEVAPEKCVFCVKLKDLRLQVGDKLQMIYDFGCEQFFDIEVTNVEPMPKGTSSDYPKIIAGEGKGILDDMPSFITLDIIKEIDEMGKSRHRYVNRQEKEMLWDYRKYNLTTDNKNLKGEMAKIMRGYSWFKQFLET